MMESILSGTAKKISAAPAPIGDFYLLTGLTVLGFGLRLANIGLRAISLDESYTLALISQGVSSIVQGAAHDIHPPLYYLLLLGWEQLAGTSLFAARLFSTLFSALLIPLAFFMAKTWLSRRGTWLVAIGVTLSPYFMELGRWGRMYSLTAFLCVLSLYLFWEYFQRKNSMAFLLAYALVTLAALYVHYFAFLILLCEYLFLALLFLRRDREWFQASAFKYWIAAQAVIGLAFMPWVNVFAQQFVKKMTPYADSRHFTLWDPVRLLYYFVVGSYSWGWLSKILAVVSFAAVGLLLARQYFSHRPDFKVLFEKRVWLWLWTIFVIPLAAAMFYSLSGSNVVDRRYLHFSALPLVIILGGWLGRMPWRRAGLIIGLMLLSFLVPIQHLWFQYGPGENWHTAAGLIKANRVQGDLLIFHPSYCSLPIQFYLDHSAASLSLPGQLDINTLEDINPVPINPAALSKLDDTLRPCQRIWLVLGNHQKFQGAVVKSWLTGLYGAPREYAFPGGLVCLFIRTPAKKAADPSS